jgi:type II secretion system protein D
MRWIGLGLTAVTCSLSVWQAEFLSAEVKLFGKKAGKPAAAQPTLNEQAVTNALAADETLSNSDSRLTKSSDKAIKLSYFNQTWDHVLRDIAKQSDRQLVMDKVPPGRFSRNDWSRYSLDDTLKVLNRELEPKGFRVLGRGQYLDLVFLRDARSEYARPVVGTSEPPSDTGTLRPIGQQNVQLKPPNNSRATRDPFLQQAAFEEREQADDEELELTETPRRWVEVTLKHQTARNVSRSLYQAFEQDAELIDQGPNGFPGFVVWKDAPTATRAPARLAKTAPKRIARFAIGVDTKKDRLLIDGSPAEIAAVKNLVAKLDVVANSGDRTVRLVATKRDPQQVVQVLNSAVKQLAQAHATERSDETELAQAEAPAKAKAKNSAKKKSQSQPATTTNPADPQQPSDEGAKDSPADKSEMPDVGGPLKGDVTIEELNGMLILRGNEQDVAIVQRLIDQIGRMLAGTVPDINVRPLKHVDSESLADLLTTVYERLNRARGRTAQDQSQQIVVIAIGKPNAVIVLAAPNDMPLVNDLIDELDQPVDPSNEFEVFRLRYAVASQVLTAIESFFSGTTTGGAGGQAPTTGSTTRSTAGGLRGRVRAISDSRTNSVIVQARPRDLEEVRRLIGELDQVGSQAVNQIKLIPLKNAVADEMAELLNLAIQSVISPPQQVRTQQGVGGGFGTQGGGFGGQGQADPRLREAKSAVLQYLDTEDGERMIESGVLSDIRINSDLRTNSLVVTAPSESIVMIEALVKKFDQPASLVAEIKHFTLKNADATSVTTLLNQLFNNQQQQGQGQRGGLGNQQNQQLGIQLAGAEDASSQLIPLRLSTDVRTNSIIAVGGGEALSVVEAIILRLDEDDVRQRKMTVYRLKNSPAAQVAQSITAFLQSQSDLANQANQGLVSNFEQFEREVIVVAESNSNSLLISATPRYYDDILKVVEFIDMDQQQVVIQALLVEVELTNNDEFGVELGIQDALLFDRSGTATVGGVANTLVPGYLFNNQALANTTNGLNNSNQVGGQGLSNFSLGRTNGDLGFGGLVLSAGSESVSVLLRALSANRTVEILSRPQIRTLDNQLGRINVGRNVPVINGFTNNGALGQIVPTVIRDDSGIILEVTPRITPDGRIVMQIGAERSAYLTDAANSVVLTTDSFGNAIRAPVKEVSRAVSTIAVADEQTIVLGGLIQKTETTLERKVPWLGDVPVLGHAFRFDGHSCRRTELLIFLTPRIVKNNEMNEMLKQIEAERLHYTECDAEAMHGPLFGVPAPANESALPPVYPRGGVWSNQKNNAVPLPPAPMPNGPDAKVPPVPPMSNEPPDGVKGAIYQESGSRPVMNSRVQPVGATTSSKAIRKPTILDTFRRKEAQR